MLGVHRAGSLKTARELAKYILFVVVVQEIS
jgi:hypothetical protein